MAGNAGAALSARQDAARSFAAQLRIEPFKLDVPEAALADLRERLARTRALHVFLDAKELKARLENLPLLDNTGNR